MRPAIQGGKPKRSQRDQSHAGQRGQPPRRKGATQSSAVNKAAVSAAATLMVSLPWITNSNSLSGQEPVRKRCKKKKWDFH